MSGLGATGLMALIVVGTAALTWASLALDRLGASAVRDLNRLASDIKDDNRRSAKPPPSVKGGS